MITKHRHLFEDSVCLGFKTFTDASEETEKREGKSYGIEDISLLRWEAVEMLIVQESGIPPGESKRVVL